MLIALEHKGMNEQFTVSQHAANMEPDKMLLIAGEKLTLRELLDEDFNNSYSTVYDLVVLTRYLIRHFPEVGDRRDEAREILDYSFNKLGL